MPEKSAVLRFLDSLEEHKLAMQSLITVNDGSIARNLRFKADSDAGHQAIDKRADARS